MALDWNKEISVDMIKDLFNRKKGAAQVGLSGYPTKTTMNLYQSDKQSMDLRKVVILAVVLVLGMGLFLKFGMFDQFAKLHQKEAELVKQQELAMATAGTTGDYKSIKEAYDAYTARYGSAMVDAIMVLDMVEQFVKPAASVTSIVLSDGTLTLTVQNASLNTVGDLAKTLEGQPLVSSVNVSTATMQNKEGQNMVSTLVITLASVSSEG